MSDIKPLIAKIFKDNQHVIDNIQDMLTKLGDIFNEKTEKYIINIKKDIELLQPMLSQSDKIDDLTIQDTFSVVNRIEHCTMLIQHIYKTLQKLLDKTQNSETYLSQTFIDETFSMHKKIVVVYNRISKLEESEKQELIAHLTKNALLNEQIKTNTIQYVKLLQSLLQQYPYAIDLYCEIMSEIIKKVMVWHTEDKQLLFTIMAIIEEDKSRILKSAKTSMTTMSKSATLNPYYKTFGLIPLTNLLPITDISMLVFKKAAKTMSEFIKFCKDGDYGLIIINKHVAHPISYQTNQLLDWKQSQHFAEEHKQTFGADAEILKRYATITKIDVKSSWNFSTETHALKFNNYEAEKNKYVIILDSLAPGMFRINANFLSMAEKYFIRISSIKELYMYCSGDSNATRIGQYNAICIKGAKPLIFAPVKPDLEKIQETSSIVDPKYLRNQIYLLLLDAFNLEFKKHNNGKSIADNYTYASIIHDDKFLGIFSDVLVHEFHSYLYKTYSDYLTGHVPISEIVSSFMNVIYIYQRTFVKEIHDYFKDNLFDFTQDDLPAKLKNHFDEMVRNVLDKIITADSNVYQMVLYKINLLKNTII